MSTVNLHSAAAKLATHFSALPASNTIVQFVVRDEHATAHLVIGRDGGQENWSLREGKHARPTLTLYLDSSDLLDISELGCVRQYVATHGDQQLVSLFRSKFMSISAEGKERIERKTAQTEHTAVERVSPDSVSSSDFIERFAVGSCPVVVTDAMPLWRKNRPTMDEIRQRFGDLDVHLRVGDYARNIYKREMETRVTKLGPYLERCMHIGASSADAVPEYAANNGVPMEWSEWLDYPPFVPRALCAYAKFWVGPAGTVTPMHRDWADNFLTQVVGTKEVAMLPPHCSSVFAPRAVHPLLDSCNWIDPYRHDDGLTRQLEPLFATLDAGEMLFLPAGWFHHVRSTSLSLSVNFFLQRVPYAACPPARPS